MRHWASIAIGLALLGACQPAPDPGAARLVDGPRRGPPRATPRPPAPPPAGEAPPERLPGPGGPVIPPAGPAPTPPGAPLVEPPLPPPWPDEALAVVATPLSRRVLASEQVVGLAATQGGGLLALSAEGGLFTTPDWRPLRARLTPLPAEGFTRLAQDKDQLLACRSAGAWSSPDGGRTWRPEAFGCGADGRQTVALLGGRRLRLVGDRLRIEALPDGALVAEVALALAAPQALLAFDRTVVVFGRRGVVRSLDGGLSFHPAARDDGGTLAVSAGGFLQKSRAVAVGITGPDQAQALLSVDGGGRWRAVPLPRRAEALQALAADGSGRLLAVPTDPAGAAVQSLDGGERWAALPDRRPVAWAAVGQAEGFEAASPRGIALDLSEARPSRSLGLEQPLWAVAVSHPRVAVGAGLQAGLFRSRDGGRSWARLPGTEGVRFADVTRVAGHRIVAVGDGLLWGSDDGGGRFERVPPPASCEARWVRFAQSGLGIVACADGSTLRSVDGGAGWAVGAALPAPSGPLAWQGRRALAAQRDGAGLVWTTDGGLSFDEGPGPAPGLVEVQAVNGGWSVATAEGWIGWAPEPEGPWTARFEAPLGPTRAHRWLAEGLVRLAPEGVWLHAPASPPQALGPAAPGARALLPSGDGGLWVLGEQATVALAPGAAEP